MRVMFTIILKIFDVPLTSQVAVAPIVPQEAREYWTEGDIATALHALILLDSRKTV